MREGVLLMKTKKSSVLRILGATLGLTIVLGSGIAFAAAQKDVVLDMSGYAYSYTGGQASAAAHIEGKMIEGRKGTKLTPLTGGLMLNGSQYRVQLKPGPTFEYEDGGWEGCNVRCHSVAAPVQIQFQGGAKQTVEFWDWGSSDWNDWGSTDFVDIGRDSRRAGAGMLSLTQVTGLPSGDRSSADLWGMVVGKNQAWDFYLSSW